MQWDRDEIASLRKTLPGERILSGAPCFFNERICTEEVCVLKGHGWAIGFNEESVLHIPGWMLLKGNSKP